MPKPLVLVGLMGAGKSAVGRRVAAKLRVPFIDADSEIEIAVCGHTDPADVRVTCDGAAILTMEKGDKLSIRRHANPVRLLHPVGHDHFNVLRAKLGWGELPSS